MTAALDIRPRDLATVRAILARTLPMAARVWVFGSRARGAAKRTADLDLAIDAGRPLTLEETATLNAAFDDSDLPWTVDVVDWRTADPGFRAIIEGDRVALEV